jgi:hypothetical protein
VLMPEKWRQGGIISKIFSIPSLFIVIDIYFN